MLKNFVKMGISVLDMWKASRKLKKEGRMADVFLANNVFIHVPELNAFVEEIKTL